MENGTESILDGQNLEPVDSVDPVIETEASLQSNVLIILIACVFTG